VQFVVTLRAGGSVVNFFSFFTIESNLIAAAWALAVPSNGALRGAATLYMAITGIVFALLLAGFDSLLLPWINVLLHDLFPAALVLAWLLEPPELPSGDGRLIVTWLAFPFAFGIYAEIRGAIVGWYPYPFLDPRWHGPVAVAGAMAGIALLGSLLAFGLIRYARRRRSAGVSTPV
jgi:hypothetical protein